MVSDSLTDACYGRARVLSGSDSPMLIVCPNCATSYQVEPSSLGAAGRSVRCARCQNHVVHPPSPGRWPPSTRRLSRRRRLLAAEADPAEPSAPLPGRGRGAGPASPVVEERQHLPETRPGRVRHTAYRGGRPPASRLDPTTTSTTRASPLPSTTDWRRAEHDGARGRPPTRTLPEDIETFAARRLRQKAARRRAHWPLPGLPTAILALVALNAALIGWRADVVRILPQTASLYAAIGFRSTCAASSSPTSRARPRPMTACRCWWSRAPS